LKIELDETELTHILDALTERIKDLTDTLAPAGDHMIEDEIAALEEFSFDLFESLHRDDGWDDIPALDAGAEFIQAGIDAREQVKASSRAAERRSERMLVATASPVSNDPIDW
jgi:hypothetical protein